MLWLLRHILKIYGDFSTTANVHWKVKQMCLTFKALALIALTTFVYVPDGRAEPQRYTAEQVRADIDAIEAGIAMTHPDLAHSVQPAHVTQALEALRRRVHDGMDQDAVWRELSTLNPLFADAHFFVPYPSWRGETKRHLEQGHTLFPFEVSVDMSGRVRIVSELGGARSPHAGASIDAINGIPARDIARELLAHVHGDSLRFRADLLSKRWWFFFWKVHGAPSNFDIALQNSNDRPLRIPGSSSQPATMIGEEDFNRNFAFELLPDGVALMTVRTFSWADPDAFFEFTRRSFQRMRMAGTRSLLIDVRQNGGGDDAMWLKGLLPYIADRPYRWASRYTKRVLKDDPEKQERAGDVLSGSVDTWMSPLSDNPLHFGGKVRVLVGAGTYSSAVLFANTMQDFGLGMLIGEGSSVRTTQTGGIQRIDLPNSGLVLWSPRFVLVRPSGKPSPQWLTPDVTVADDPLDAQAMISAARVAETSPGGSQ